MEDQKQLAPAQKLLESAKSVVVILPGDPSSDLVSAAISLHLSLKSAGKKSQIGCGTEVKVDKEILGVQEIADSIGSRNLIISFNYHEDDLEKVDYDTHPDGKFYLMIKPKAGSPVPDVSNVKYSYSGASADLVITLGINSLEELGKIYADEKTFLDTVKVLSLNTSSRPASFTPNFIHLLSGSYSELMAIFIEKIGLQPPSEAAQNLLTSIYSETKNITSPKMTADTFAAISFLMRQGARLPNQQTVVHRFSQPAFFESPVGATHESPAYIIPSAVEESPLTPDEDNIPLPQEETPQAIPQDWTKPKIFRATDM